MKIGITSDHRGYKLKEKIITKLSNKGYEFVDYGTNSEESVDFPSYAFDMCEGIINKKITYGIAICGTGIGMSIACNKVKNIMCARVVNVKEAKLARQHNNANVLALNESMKLKDVEKIIEIFINTNLLEDKKYARRIKQIKKYEEK